MKPCIFPFPWRLPNAYVLAAGMVAGLMSMSPNDADASYHSASGSGAAAGLPQLSAGEGLHCWRRDSLADC